MAGISWSARAVEDGYSIQARITLPCKHNLTEYGRFRRDSSDARDTVTRLLNDKIAAHVAGCKHYEGKK